MQLVDEEVLGCDDALTELNLRLRSLWASTSILLKPWNGGIPRTKDGKFTTANIPQIAARIDQGFRRLPKLFNDSKYRQRSQFTEMILPCEIP